MKAYSADISRKIGTFSINTRAGHSGNPLHIPQDVTRGIGPYTIGLGTFFRQQCTSPKSDPGWKSFSAHSATSCMLILSICFHRICRSTVQSCHVTKTKPPLPRSFNLSAFVEPVVRGASHGDQVRNEQGFSIRCPFLSCSDRCGSPTNLPSES